MNIEIIPALSDNYIYLIFDLSNKKAIVIDPSSADPVIKLLERKNIQLTHILNTHHHFDHIGGNNILKEKYKCKIIASKYDKDRVPNIDIMVEDNSVFIINGIEIKTIYVPGHTLGHVAYFLPKQNWLFTGDTLFSAGCGRLFEGTASQMVESLTKLSNLPKSTKIFCGHEYTINNLKFALTIEPENLKIKNYLKHCEELIRQNKPTLPSTIENELEINPFLRTKNVDIHRKLKLENPIEIFTELRSKKDIF